jgi:hypothetical protein
MDEKIVTDLCPNFAFRLETHFIACSSPLEAQNMLLSVHLSPGEVDRAA